MAECFYPKDGRKYYPQLKELKPELFESFMTLPERPLPIPSYPWKP